MTDSIVVSIIIPCYNAASFIQETITSVLSQAYSNLELIVVDDGSTDGSAEMVRRDFPTVKVISTPNQGVSHARNIGTRLATGRYIRYLDADDLIPSGEILRQQVEILENSEADILCSDWQPMYLQKDGSYTFGEVNVPFLTNDPETDMLTQKSWLPVHCCLYKRHVLEKVQWNETLRTVEDVRFIVDCATAGFRFLYHSGVVGIYRVRPTSLSHHNLNIVDNDRLTNIKEIKTLWATQTGLTESRRAALLECLSRLALSFGLTHFDYQRLRETLDLMQDLQKEYVPQLVPSRVRWLAKYIGYERALFMAGIYHRVRRKLGGSAYLTTGLE